MAKGRARARLLEDGALYELEDEVQLALATEDFDQVHNVVVFELLE